MLTARTLYSPYGGCRARAWPIAWGRSRNESTSIVGETNRRRKADSPAVVQRIMELVEPAWSRCWILTGLASGEGLIDTVRGPVERLEEGDTVEMIAENVSDKRALVIAAESSWLMMFAREGSTLSDVLREARDGNFLAITARTRPVRATNPRVSVIGHVAPAELHHSLTTKDTAHGGTNRFRVLVVERDRLLEIARQRGEMKLSDSAAETWKPSTTRWRRTVRASWASSSPARGHTCRRSERRAAPRILGPTGAESCTPGWNSPRLLPPRLPGLCCGSSRSPNPAKKWSR